MANRYIVDEKELQRLVSRDILLSALERDGVDNWSWYGESFREVLAEYGGEDDEDFNFDAAAATVLKSDYQLFDESGS